MTVLAHLSDTHFDGGARNAARAQQVMDYLHALPGGVDAIVVTGDVTHNGLPHEWEQAGKVLASTRYPVYTCHGNHDGYTPYDWPVNRAHPVGGVVLTLCDSVVLGRDDGHLSDATLAWLASALTTHADRPVLVAFHHPPVELGHPLIDEIRMFGSHRLAALLEIHPNAVAVLCGHAHTAAVSMFAGRPLLVAPGVSSTLCLPWEIDGEPAWRNAVDLGQPPALAFHLIDDAGRVTTHFRLIPE